VNIKLHPLNKGDLISLAAPAHAVKPEDIKMGRELFESQGFRVRVTKNALKKDQDKILNRFAGPDEERIQQFNSELANPEVKAICCLTGGYGVSRILDRIDFDLLKQHPKIICGFSDITALHLGIFRECEMVSLHSPNGDSMPLISITKKAWLQALGGELIEIPSRQAEPFLQDDPIETWHSGKAHGFLVGGNLSLVSALVGTPHALPENKDLILFLEDIGEFAYRVDLMLQQLWLSGSFEFVKGLILGQFTKRDKQETEPITLMDQVLKRFCENLNIPVLANFPIGHVKKNLTVAHGAHVVMDADNQSLKYTQSIFKNSNE